MRSRRPPVPGRLEPPPRPCLPGGPAAGGQHLALGSSRLPQCCVEPALPTWKLLPESFREHIRCKISGGRKRHCEHNPSAVGPQSHLPRLKDRLLQVCVGSKLANVHLLLMATPSLARVQALQDEAEQTHGRCGTPTCTAPRSCTCTAGTAATRSSPRPGRTCPRPALSPGEPLS